MEVVFPSHKCFVFCFFSKQGHVIYYIAEVFFFWVFCSNCVHYKDITCAAGS